MNLKDAYKILDLPAGSSLEDTKKKYKELTRKYHPDVNKDPDAEVKFKKINEAFSRIKQGDEPESNNSPFEGFGGFNPFSGRRNVRQQVSIENISVHANVSFEESVLGTKKTLSFDRKLKCQPCDGDGSVKIDNGCEKCHGKGQVSNVRGNMVFIQTCDKCFGNVKSKTCSTCNGEGIVESNVSVNVNIPGGITNGNVLRLAGMGNFVGKFMSIEQSTDVHLHVNVDPDPDLYLDGADVFCTLQLSLLEALQGCNKTVRTVLGSKEITIPPLSKHNEFINIPKAGVNKKGNQKVLLDVVYPKNIDKVIKLLNNQES